VNRQEIAEYFGVMPATIDSWIRKGMPVDKAGSNGRPYVIDPQKADVWRKAHIECIERDRVERDVMIERVRRELGICIARDESAEELSFEEQRRYYAAELARMQIEERRGELIRADRVRALLERQFVSLRDFLQSLPDYLERSSDLNPETAEDFAEAISDFQERLVSDVRDRFRNHA